MRHISDFIAALPDGAAILPSRRTKENGFLSTIIAPSRGFPNRRKRRILGR
jgi:hypothetical protein